MRIEQELDLFVICRGSGYRESFFCFFVDDDNSCWTSKSWKAQRFGTREVAEETLGELKSRAAKKRKKK